MAQLHEHPRQDAPVVIRERDNSEGGMGLGVILGIIVTVVVAGAIIMMLFNGSLGGGATDAPASNENNPTININPPGINVPDKIEVNPPAQPNSVPAP